MKEMLKKLFKGKDNPKEEMKEAKAVKSGKVTPAQYAKGEKMEGEKASKKSLEAKAQKMKSGKMTPREYASSQKKK